VTRARPGASCALVCAALLVACANPRQTPPSLPAGPEPAAHAPPASIPPDLPLTAFARAQRAAAHAAAQQGRWADALWAWDVVLALDPQDAQALQQRAAAQNAAAAAVAERLPRAQQAQQRGEWDAALRGYIDVLAIDPGHIEAAEGLRETERLRTRRGLLGGSREAYANPPPRDRAASTRTPATKPSTARPPAVAGASINDREHASLLASQGDIDEAIALLRPLATAPGANPATRQQLANLYFRQASKLELTDRSGAVVALENGLALDPGNRYATARLKVLRAVPAAAPALPAR
jgi:tetratricopeptide (TPR) repeat protein